MPDNRVEKVVVRNKMCIVAANALSLRSTVGMKIWVAVNLRISTYCRELLFLTSEAESQMTENKHLFQVEINFSSSTESTRNI